MIDNETTVAEPPEIESTLIRYSIPVKGDVEIGASFSMHLDDLRLEFISNERLLCELIVIAPLPKDIPPIADLPNQAGGSDEPRLWEPRALEIEEMVLNAANLLSTVCSILVEIQFDARKIEWIHKRSDGYLLSGVTVEMAGRKLQPPVRVHPEIVSRSFITSRVLGAHDPSLTFYKRGMADTAEHRYIVPDRKLSVCRDGDSR